MLKVYFLNSMNKLIIVIFILIMMIKTTLSEDNKSPGVILKPYREYYIDHIVTEKEAAKSYKELMNQLLNGPVPDWCELIPCTRKFLQYCLGYQMLHDHCCCDSRHGKEQLPWLPHSCYVGDTCKANAGSCMMYTELKECCCDKIVAKQWQDVFSSSTTLWQPNLKPKRIIYFIFISIIVSSFYVVK